ATRGSARPRTAAYTPRKSRISSSPENHASPASPNHCSVRVITISESHWVGTQSRVAKVLTLPGWRSDHPFRNSSPNLRWKYVSVLVSGRAQLTTRETRIVSSARGGRKRRAGGGRRGGPGPPRRA